MPFHRFKSFTAALGLLLIPALNSLAVHADTSLRTPGAAFSLQDNARFAGVASGFAGALGVEVGQATTPAQFAAARRQAVQTNALAQKSRERSASIFRRMGALGARTPLSNPRIIAYTRNGKLPERETSARTASATTTARSAVQASSLSTRASNIFFKFDGFSSQQVTDFAAFRDAAYPLMVQVYGEPSPLQQGRLVTVINDPFAGDGIYELPPSGSTTSGGTIRYEPVTTSGGLSSAEALAINTYNLTRLMLIAFHGERLMAFDSWERGFADAAALVVAYKYVLQVAPANAPTFDPSMLGVYLLPVYDVLNRPELGSPYFFAADTSPNLGFYRLGMAQAAWIKVWVENPNFFANFNTAYYAQYSAALAGNTPVLKSIAQSLVPQVEGLSFSDWYRRQYVLDTAITTGEKLWLAVFPLANQTSGDTRSQFFGVAQRYSTDSSGNETPLSGTGHVSIYDELGLDITTRSAELRNDTRVIFNNLGEAELNSQNVISGLPIIGLEATGSPEMGRFSVVISIDNAEATAIFPYNVAGTTSAPSGFYGATIGANSGTALTIVSNSVTRTPPTWSRGAYMSAAAYPTGPQVKTTFSFTPSGEVARSVQRNSAWSSFGGISQSLAAIFEARSAGSAVPVNLTTSGANNLRMISLPLYPVQSDEAAVLGLPSSSLLLARYLTTPSPSGFSSSGITFGINTERHELYPNISEGFVPGRGYWLKLDAPLSTSVQGSEPPRNKVYEVPLRAGWTQFGLPFNLPFAMAAVRVSKDNTAPVPFATAVQNGWLGAGVWRWKAAGGYARVDSGSATDQQLAPFEGYYIFSTVPRGLKLVFNSSAAQATALTEAANTAGNWQLPITVTQEQSSDSGALGVSTVTGGKPLRAAAAKPPTGPTALNLSFLSSGNSALDETKAGNASGWHSSYIAPFAASATGSWRFLVDGTTSGKTVRLTWGNTATLPTLFDITLIDETTGARIALSQSGVPVISEYTYISNGSARVFRMEARANSLRVTVTSPPDGALFK